GHRLDRMQRFFERRLGDENLLGRVLRGGRMVLDRGLELGVDAGQPQDLLDLLGLGDVLRQGYLNHLGHAAPSSPTDTASSTGAGSCSRRCSAPPFTSLGPPRSSNPTSIVSKSFGTTVAGNTVRASRAASRPR